jgi:hypothetical protein
MTKNLRTRIYAPSGAALIALAVAAVAAAAPPQIKIGVYSQNEGSTHANAHASIAARRERPEQPAHHAAVDLSSSLTGTPTTAKVAAPSYPTLPATSALAKNPTPFGPGTFWYPGGPDVSCVYSAGSSPLCYRIIGPARGATPGVDPATVASSIAARFDLAPGTIATSPGGEGLTGAPSWFWLDPSPTTRQATITLAGETVTVSATPTIDWAFGDGATLADAGPGTPYAPGPPPASAVIRTYQTRCLAGDQGRNPNVLPSCQTSGYRVVATVVWTIAYRASGPVSATGTVPARTTDADRNYPVSEARAFLVGATQ